MEKAACGIARRGWRRSGLGGLEGVAGEWDRAERRVDNGAKGLGTAGPKPGNAGARGVGSMAPSVREDRSSRGWRGWKEGGAVYGIAAAASRSGGVRGARAVAKRTGAAALVLRRGAGGGGGDRKKRVPALATWKSR